VQPNLNPEEAMYDISEIRDFLDEFVLNRIPSERLRSKGVELPFSCLDVEDGFITPNPFPCVTIKYWPNGKDPQQS
jgi:hypothetical protein